MAKLKHPEIVAKIPLRDKIRLCSGRDFWRTMDFSQYGVPSMRLVDGPHGVRKQEETPDNLGMNGSLPATCFPPAAATAQSFDETLLLEIGEALGEEANAMKVGVVLGPAICMKRNPLCGRNFEYFSEDPLLAGKLGAAHVRGMAKKGVGASVKHFALNDQEYRRFSSDSVADERTMRELYLSAFEHVVKEAKPATVMSAYNRINGTFCSDNKWLLTDVLRGEWGFDGVVVSDWGGLNDRIESFRAGCDLMMPGGAKFMIRETMNAVKSDALDEALIDESADRIIDMAFNHRYATDEAEPFDIDAHHALAKRAAVKSAVLLKNEDGILPLREGANVALIGHMAKKLRYQGGGSSHTTPTRLNEPVDTVKHAAYAEGCDEKGDTSDVLISEAVAAAKAADIAVVFAGLSDAYESEGFDRADMKMPAGHVRLIREVARANANTVVVLLCGSAVELDWLDEVKAVLYMALPGQAGAEAIAELLYGGACPAGKLAETWPLRYEDCVSAPYWVNGNTDALYMEGLYMGYRYYDKAEKPVRFPFGYGLSYTTFEYSDMQADEKSVSATIKNTGACAGDEIVMLFVAPPQDGIYRPKKELRGFCRVQLSPGESKRVTIDVDERAYMVYADGWKRQRGEYELMLCASCEDVRLRANISVSGEEIPAPAWQSGSFYENAKGAPTLSGFEAMLGRKCDTTRPKKGEFDINNTIVEMKEHSALNRLAYKFIVFFMKKDQNIKDDNDPMLKMAVASTADCSLRGLHLISGGLFPMWACRLLLRMGNGFFTHR